MSEQSNEIMEMMDSYRSHPLHEFAKTTPWWLVSALLHGALAIIACYVTWEVKLPKEDIIIEPKIERKFIPPMPVMISPKPIQDRKEVTDIKRVVNDIKISQTNLPDINKLFSKKKLKGKRRSMLLTPGENPVYVGELGDGLMCLSGTTEAAIGDIVGWGGWKGHILAVWLFDESLSMKNDQKQIRDRVDEVYDKLELAAGVRGTSMRIVTTVASYGKNTHILIKKPTNKVEDIRQAIDKVPVDKSGDENYLKAINTVLGAFGPYAKKYKRRIVIILVTDEGGDDDDPKKTGADSPLEQTVARLKSVNASVLVFGKLGGFHRTGTSERVPGIARSVWVHRGRDTGRLEFMLPEGGLFSRWGFLHAGFGPYQYARLSHETGGMLFLLNTMTSTYDYEKLLDGYQPELVSRQEMLVRDRKNLLRRTIRQCLMDWRAERKKYPIIRSFRQKNLEHRIGQGVKFAQSTITFCNKWIPRLESTANTSVPDSPKRWQADRDLVVAQLYKRRYIAKEYLMLLKDLKEQRNIPAPGNLGWVIYGYSRRPSKNQHLQKQLALVKSKYQMIIDKHDGTPWAEFARREIRTLSGPRIAPYNSGRSVRSIRG